MRTINSIFIVICLILSFYFVFDNNFLLAIFFLCSANFIQGVDTQYMLKEK
jgi:hypothetical protein